MTEQESKGFKVVDKRSMTDEEREKSSPPPPPPAQDAGGNREAGPGIEGKEGAGDRPAGIGAPTFLDLLSTLQFGAMANLGMIQTPEGKRFPVNLPAAKDSIDVLALLQDKTKGNLTAEETEVMTEGLYHLRMAYAALINAGQGPGGKGK